VNEDEDDDRVAGDGRRQQQSGRDLFPPPSPPRERLPFGIDRPRVDLLVSIGFLYSVGEERKRWCLRTRRKTETAAANEITTFPFSKPV